MPGEKINNITKYIYIFDKRRNGRRTAVSAIEGLCTAAGVNPVTPPHFTSKNIVVHDPHNCQNSALQ